MPAKKYFEGMKIGPNKILFIEEISKGKDKKGRFLCPICHSDQWITRVSDVAKGKSSKCLSCRQQKDKERILQYNNNCKLDLTGQTKGYLTVIKSLNQKDNSGHYLWLTKCKCGKEYIINSSNFIRASNNISCGCNKESLGETKIKNILQNCKINFIQEYKFQNCKNIQPLPFDFYLPDYNTCIEYDGKQHFEEISFGQHSEGLEQRQYNDNIKNQYCIKHNIHLIRIPYWDYDVINQQYILDRLQQKENK